MTEIAIGEAHAGDRSPEAAFVFLFQIEALLERNAPDLRADGLAADLKRIAGQSQVPHRTGAGKLHRARSAIVLEDAPCAAGTIEAGEGEQFAGYKSAGFIRVHHSGHCGHHHCAGRSRPQHKTRKHASLQLDPSAGNRLIRLYPLLTILTVATLEQLGW
jgi:hypothetical protein